MGFFKETFDHIKTDGDLIRKSWVSLGFSLSLGLVAIWAILQWHYSGILQVKDAQIEALKLIPIPSQETLDLMSGTTNQISLPKRRTQPWYVGAAWEKLTYNGVKGGFQKGANSNVSRFIIVPIINEDSPNRSADYLIMVVFEHEQAQPLNNKPFLEINDKPISDLSKIEKYHDSRCVIFEIHQELNRGDTLKLGIKP